MKYSSIFNAQKKCIPQECPKEELILKMGYDD